MAWTLAADDGDMHATPLLPSDVQHAPGSPAGS
jgi:hypothetical protein